MNQDSLVLGHWAKNTFVHKGDPLIEGYATEDFMRWLVGRSRVCPYKKSDGEVYSKFKSKYLPILWFTGVPYRFDKDNDSVFPTGFCVIDIDNTHERISTNHPSVFAINHTSNGVHIICHSDGAWGSTRSGWQHSYDRLAYAMQRELEPEYGLLKFDPKNSFFEQGCYIWQTEWVFNKNFDPSWSAPEHEPTDDEIAELYDKRRNRADDTKPRTAVDVIRGSVEEIATHAGMSEQVISDFMKMPYWEFYMEYLNNKDEKKRFEPFCDEKGEYREVEDIDGNIYSMCENNGTLFRYYMPWNGKIPKGERRKSVFLRAVNTAKNSGDAINADRILWDAVYYYVTFCDRWLGITPEDMLTNPKYKKGSPHDLDKREFILTVCDAIAKRERWDCKRFVENSKWMAGDYMIEKGTGNRIDMDKKMKIAATHKCRRMKTIEDALWHWDAGRTLDGNIDNIMSWLGIKSRQTVVNYIKEAQGNGKLLKKHPFLKDIVFTAKKTNPKAITIVNIEDGSEHAFKTRSECMEFLGIKNRKTFSRFLKGETSLNKKFKCHIY